MQRNVINAFGSMLATLSLFSGVITVMVAASERRRSDAMWKRGRMRPASRTPDRSNATSNSYGMDLTTTTFACIAVRTSANVRNGSKADIKLLLAVIR